MATTRFPPCWMDRASSYRSSLTRESRAAFFSTASRAATRLRWLGQGARRALEAATFIFWQAKHVGQIQPPHLQRPRGLSASPGLLWKEAWQAGQITSRTASRISKSSAGAIRRKDSPSTITRYWNNCLPVGWANNSPFAVKQLWILVVPSIRPSYPATLWRISVPSSNMTSTLFFDTFMLLQVENKKASGFKAQRPGAT